MLTLKSLMKGSWSALEISHWEINTSILVQKKKKHTVSWLEEDRDEKSKDLSQRLGGLFFEGVNVLCYKVLSVCLYDTTVQFCIFISSLYLYGCMYRCTCFGVFAQVEDLAVITWFGSKLLYPLYPLSHLVVPNIALNNIA